MSRYETPNPSRTVRSRLIELRTSLRDIYTEREESEFATFYNGFVEHGFSKKGLFESQAACRRALEQLAEAGQSTWKAAGLETDLSDWIARIRQVAGGCDAIPCEDQVRNRPVGTRLSESLLQVDRWIAELSTADA